MGGGSGACRGSGDGPCCQTAPGVWMPLPRTGEGPPRMSREGIGRDVEPIRKFSASAFVSGERGLTRRVGRRAFIWRRGA